MERRSAAEILATALDQIGLGQVDASSSPRQRALGIGAVLGSGAAAFLVLRGWDYLATNPDKLAEWAAAAARAGGQVLQHWDEIEVAWTVVDLVGVDTVLDVGWVAVENADLLWDAAELLGVAGEIVGHGFDLGDAVTTFGVSLVLTSGVWAVVKLANGSKEKRLKALRTEVMKVRTLRRQLELAAPVEQVVATIKTTPAAVRRT